MKDKDNNTDDVFIAVVSKAASIIIVWLLPKKLVGMTGSVLSLPDGLVGLLVGCKFLGYNDWVWLTSGCFT
jgi:hypothetical protein